MFNEKDPEFMCGFLRYLEKTKRISQKEQQKLTLLQRQTIFKGDEESDLE